MCMDNIDPSSNTTHNLPSTSTSHNIELITFTLTTPTDYTETLDQSKQTLPPSTKTSWLGSIFPSVKNFLNKSTPTVNTGQSNTPHSAIVANTAHNTGFSCLSTGLNLKEKEITDSKTALASIKENPENFEKLSSKLKEDPKFLKKAFEENNTIISQASFRVAVRASKLNEDLSFMTKLITLIPTPDVFSLANTSVQENRNFLLTACENGVITTKLKEVVHQRGDSDLLLEAVKKTPKLLNNPEFQNIITEPFEETKYGSPPTFSNRSSFMKELVTIAPQAFHLASENLKTNKDFILHTCKKDPKLLNDPDFTKHITTSQHKGFSPYSKDINFMQQLVNINPQASSLADPSITSRLWNTPKK